VTLTNNEYVSPFLSAGAAKAEDPPPVPFDDSTEGMRRLRNPFTVEPAAAGTAPTGADHTEPAGEQPESVPPTG
jgi:hypothetical protein